MPDVNVLVIQTLQEKLRSVLDSCGTIPFGFQALAGEGEGVSHEQHSQNLKGEGYIWVGYSGGIDSHVLLHSLCRLRDTMPFMLGAIHIHHGLHTEADAWAIHCQQVCAALQIPCIVKMVEVKPLLNEHSLEAAARLCRYRAFAELLSPDAILLLAHTENDQAETVLLQLFRGGGVDGLAAMPIYKRLGQGLVVRPFLSLTRSDIEAYASLNQITWIEDSSNLEERHDRNYLRHKVVPLLTKRWKTLSKTLARTATHFAEARQLLAILAQQDWLCVKGSEQTLSISKLLKLETSRQKNVIRYWLHQLGLPIPNSTHMYQILRTVLTATVDAQPIVCWNGAEIRRFRNHLYAMSPLLPHDTHSSFVWEVQKPLLVPEFNLNLSLELLQVDGVDLSDQKSVTVRFRVGGERYKPPGRKQTHCLKKLFQEWGVPPWLRDRVPLVYVGDRLVWVGYIPLVPEETGFESARLPQSSLDFQSRKLKSEVEVTGQAPPQRGANDQLLGEFGAKNG